MFCLFIYLFIFREARLLNRFFNTFFSRFIFSGAFFYNRLDIDLQITSDFIISYIRAT